KGRKRLTVLLAAQQICLFAKQSATYKGRAFHRTPPAQNRTCGFPAYGSHLGCVAAKRSLATFRMRSSACDTFARLCVRYVLCWFAFPLVPASGGHLGSRSSLCGRVAGRWPTQ